MSTYIELAEKAADDYEKKRKEQAEADIAELNKQYDQQITTAQQDVNNQIKKAENDYLTEAETIALQRELDLRDIREARANSGLSRSGLSSTEQTAAILSAGNRTTTARQNKQTAIDALNKSLMEYKTEVENNRREGTQTANANAENDVAAYRAQVLSDAQTAEKEAETTRLSTLKTLLSEEALDANVYTLAVENGWTAIQAQEYQNNRNKLGAMLEDGTIDEATHDEAVKNDYTVESVKKVEEIEKIARLIMSKETGREGPDQFSKVSFNDLSLSKPEAPSVQRMNALGGPTTQQRFTALDYLYGISGNLTIDEFERICVKLGISEEDLEAYNATKNPASQYMGGSNYEHKVFTGYTPAVK